MFHDSMELQKCIWKLKKKYSMFGIFLEKKRNFMNVNNSLKWYFAASVEKYSIPSIIDKICLDRRVKLCPHNVKHVQIYKFIIRLN